MIKSTFSALFKDNETEFLKFARSLTKSQRHAKDLVQEAAKKAYEKRDSLNDKSKFKPWFNTLMYREFLNHFNNEKRRETLLQEKGHNSHLLARRAPINRAIKRLVLADVVNLVKNSYPKSFKALWLHCKGFTYKDISTKLNLSIGTVKSRINYARNKLRSKRFFLYPAQ